MRSGRPKGATDIGGNLGRIAARKYAERAMTALAKQLDSPVGSVVVAAASTILDRAWGKPAQAVEMTGKDGGALEINDVTARETLQEKLMSLAARQAVDAAADRKLN